MGLVAVDGEGDHLALRGGDDTSRSCSLTPCATSAQPTSPERSRGRPSSASRGSSSTTRTARPGRGPRLLDRHGLEACARHAGSRRSSRSRGLARELEALGTNRLVVAWIPPPRTAREADAVAARLVAAAERVAARRPPRLPQPHGEPRWLDDGSRMLDRLLDEDAPLFLELDLGWAWYAGVDPFELVERAAGRVPIVHVKDLRRADGPMHVALGDGEIDYEALGASAAAAGVEWLVVEQDETDGHRVRGGRSIRVPPLPPGGAGMNAPARVGLVGCGVISHAYAKNAAAFDSFEIVACAPTATRRAARRSRRSTASTRWRSRRCSRTRRSTSC